MPFLGITSAQPFLQIPQSTLRARSVVDGTTLSTSFISRNKTRLVSSWKSLNLLLKLHTNVGSFEVRRGRIIIKAVATFETEILVKEHDEQKGNKNSYLETGSNPTSEFADNDSEEVDEKEKLRRMKISRANKGKMPWNKGRKHSAETIRRIKEKTRLALQDPKVRMKLISHGHAQSDETKDKIGAAVKRARLRRYGMFILQESCYFEWQNLIAEASRRGYIGEEELQWDSYEILREQHRKEWLEILEQRKTNKTTMSTNHRKAPKSPEQRRKIAEAIAAKWTNPEYRERVLSGISRYHGTAERAERKPRRKASTVQSPRQSRPKKAMEIVKEAKSEAQKPKRLRPRYKDPLASSKLEMIKDIRAQRAASEAMKAQAIARARLSIAEAEKAAKALEPAAEKSSIALEALMETRRLIAEAIQSIEASATNGEEPLDGWIELASQFEEDKDELQNHEEHININGTQTRIPSYREKAGYGKVSVQDILLNDHDIDEEFVSSTRSRKRNNLPQLNVEDLVKQFSTTPVEQLECPSPNEAFDLVIEDQSPPISVAKTKKWVRGRLIEVSEEGDEEEHQDMSDKDEGLSEGVEDWSQSEEDQSHDEQEILSVVEDWSQSEEEDRSLDGKEALSEEVKDNNSQSEQEDHSHDEREALSEEDQSSDRKEALSEEEDWSHGKDDVNVED